LVLKSKRGETVNISWSFLRAYEKCPLQQKLIRIDGLGPEKVDERRFIRGTTGHKFFEIWARRGFDDKITPDEAANILDDLVAKKHIVWFSGADYDKLKKMVVNEALMLMEAAHWHGIDRLNNFTVEKWVSKSLPFGNHMIRGLIDMVAGGGKWILETKMSTNAKWIDPDQLVFYGLLLGMAGRRYPTRLSFFLPVMNKVQDRLRDVEFSNNDFSKMYERVKDFIKRWTSGEFPATGDKDTCWWCEVKAHCIKDS
jgi:hypothetical protein